MSAMFEDGRPLTRKDRRRRKALGRRLVRRLARAAKHGNAEAQAALAELAGASGRRVELEKADGYAEPGGQGA